MLCQIVDPDDESTVLFDLHDVENADAGEPGCTILGFDWGQISPEYDELKTAPYPGSMLVNAHDPPVEATLLCSLRGDDFEDLQARVMALQKLLQRGGVIKWARTDEPRYADFEVSPRGSILKGQASEWQAIALARGEVFDFEVRIRRHPYWRLADEELVTDQVVTWEEPFVQFTNPGTHPSELRISIRNDGADQPFVGVLLARRSRGPLAEFAAEAVIDVSSGPVSNTFWAKDAEVVLTPTSGLDLDGVFRVQARIQIDGPNDPDIGGYLRLAWGMSGAGPAGNRNGAIYIDSSDLWAFGDDVLVNLGLVHFDADAPALQLELWSTNVALHWHDLTLLPADEQIARFSSPGLHGRYGGFAWLPTDLRLFDGAELADDQMSILLTAGQSVRTTRKTLPEGEHVAHFIGSLEKQNAGGLRMVKMTVFGDGAEIVSSHVNTGKASQRSVDYADAETVRWRVTDSSVQYEVELLADFEDRPARRVRVERVPIGFIPFISDGRELVMDGRERDAWIGNSLGARHFQAAPGQFIEAEAGEQLIEVRLIGLYENGYDKVALDHGILPRAHTDWEASVTIITTPRVTQ